MPQKAHISFFTLILMISFASVNAVLFTPALPDIASFFMVSDGAIQQTITWFLVGYTVGQLIYSPLANRLGRKPALYTGICIQILSSLLCVFAGITHQFWLLVFGRLLLALGAGVGLKMTFTLLNECYEPSVASQKTSYLITSFALMRNATNPVGFLKGSVGSLPLSRCPREFTSRKRFKPVTSFASAKLVLMMAFAITPGLGVAIGGYLNASFGWISCFYAGAIYGGLLLFLVSRLPETQINRDLNAFKIKQLVHGYVSQFKNMQLVMGGLLMGAGSSIIYIFAAMAPFIAISTSGMTSEQYGLANLLPPIGLIAGSLCSANLAKKYKLSHLIFSGILITLTGVILMLITMLMHLSPLFSLFSPTILIYFGLCFIFSNASSLAMSQASDKAHGSAVMSFVNMGLATVMVLSLSYIPMNVFVLPVAYVLLCVVMIAAFKGALKAKKFIITIT